MEKKYDHKKIEPEIYHMWEKSGYFKPENNPNTTENSQSYTIVLPPPNANGKLHVGHALMIAIEDLLIRWKRMQGYSAVWIPGTDHAGFETQVVYERQLEKEGKSRLDFDRNTLYNRIYEFVEDQKKNILEQVKALGPSMDWDRYTFTLDEKVVSTVFKTFEKMSEDGLIYRDNYVVNYCTHHQTTLSDLELEHEEQITALFYVKYALVNRQPETEPEFITVATTRPEPIFVDTHLAVNPKDEKNAWLVGRKVRNPLTDAEMEIISDNFVDPEFGTGIVKLTPAHDKNDYEAAVRHNLPIIPAFGTDGVINSNGGELAGLTVSQAREKAVEILQVKDLIEKIDDKYTNRVAKCYKCGTIIEPLVLPNWFVKVDAPGKSFKQPAHEAVKSGKVQIFPKWQEIKYHRWMEEMRDWPISRQIVWGIRIPAWYNVRENPEVQVTFLKNGEMAHGKVGDLLSQGTTVSEITAGLQSLIAPNNSTYVISQNSPGAEYLQETDTFDTWFSSGHWPLVCTNYPNGNDFKNFYPTAVLETGWEILRFWVSRMIMFGLYLTSEVPFSHVYLHGLVRAADGKKMSKSLGNQVDPLESVAEYGADALRVGLISGTATGQDFNFPQDRVLAFRNFANKLWNMCRFMNLMFDRYSEEFGRDVPTFSLTNLALESQDEAILHRLNEVISSVTANLEKYRFADVAEELYHFMWDDVASQYIEHVKSREGAESKGVALSVLRYVFGEGLKLLHPLVPFITEALWAEIPGNNVAGGNTRPLIVQKWPETFEV